MGISHLVEIRSAPLLSVVKVAPDHSVLLYYSHFRQWHPRFVFGGGALRIPPNLLKQTTAFVGKYLNGGFRFVARKFSRLVGNVAGLLIVRTL